MGQLLEVLKGISLPKDAQAVVDDADIVYSNRMGQASYIQHLEAEIKNLEAEIKNLRSEKGLPEKGGGLTFNPNTGTHTDSAGQHYCTRCLSENKRSPLRNEPHGWRCMVCKKYYGDPRRPQPTIALGVDPEF